MGNLDCNTPMQRNKDGRFAPGNTLCRAGFQAMLNKHFDGDKAAFNAWFAQLGRYAYGLNYRRRGADMFWYPVWIKACFRTHPGTPASFMHQWRQSSALDVSFYQGEPF